MKKVPSVIAIMVLFFSCLQAQERIVKVDFESGSFITIQESHLITHL